MTDLINLSFTSGVFPDSLKLAKVTPVFKSEDKKSVSNYRPVSVLTAFSKIFERAMYNRIWTFINKNKIISDNQYGFRSKHSTYMAILNLIDKITAQIENKNFNIGIFLDLSKAFDTLNHKILLNKLHHYGLRGMVHNWLSSYLTNRQQYVQIGKIKSRVTNIQCGVPQGSILGPLLFILYINDLTNIIDDANIILFADDTNIFLSSKDLVTLTEKTNSVLSKISNWFQLNKLSLNIKKTNYMLFRTKNKILKEIPDIKINDHKIDQVNKTKFLGVIINETLTWKDHIEFIRQKVAKNLGILYRLSRTMPQQILISLYNSLIQPYLEYCNVIWSLDRSCALHDLFIYQKKAIRTITKSCWTAHTSPLFKRLHILPLYSINDLQLGCFVYLCLNNQLPKYFCNMFKTNANVHKHDTRHKNDLHSDGCTLHIRACTVRFAGVKLWNTLIKSANLQYASNINQFKDDLKHWLINKL